MANPAGDLPILSKADASIGLLGGTFDPVHRGHLAIARAALAELALDYVFFIPAAQAPLRGAAPVASAADRLELLKLAVAEAADPRLGVLDLEVRAGGVQYTINTVRVLQTAWPKARLWWLLGADQFGQLDRWRDAAELARRVEFAVLDRPGLPTTPPPALAALLRWRRLSGTTHPASASEIRRRGQAGELVDGWLSPAVAAAIETKKLYR
jgi:nicotinate-nucleotide adenylyltransferase